MLNAAQALMRLFRRSAAAESVGRAVRARVRMQVEEIESRILHSADFTPAAFADLTGAQVQMRVLDAAPVVASEPSVSQESSTRELVVVDTATDDYQQLVDDLVAQDGRNFQILLIERDSDGVARLSDALSSLSDVAAVHIISHGSDGKIHLGSSAIDFDALRERAAEITAWSNALTPDADLLIYGCDVAASADGRLLVDALARLTGADVMASEDATGSSAQGGDWNLEYRTGSIESGVAISAATQGSWQGILAVDVVLESYVVPFVDLDKFEVKSGQSWGQTFRYDSAGATYEVDKFSVVLWRESDASAGQTITLSLRSSWNGAALASGTISSDALTTTQTWVSGTLATPINLNDNQTYYIRVDSNGDGKVYAGANGNGNYARGDLINKDGNAENGKDMAFRIVDSVPTVAPVLGGANNLSIITEDQASNGGTLVSSLIAGHVTDADPGALGGIAVTGVDDTNGTWQYSTNGGASWASFGSPTAAAARLLAADANTSVRFVPNANWNGTVANGLTFRAWDQTSGANGGTADTSSPTLSVLDTFNLNSYSNNNGTANWSGGWVDSDGSFSGGAIQITGNALRVDVSSNATIHRGVDLSGATSATLSFSYNNQVPLLGGSVALQMSSNGGASYTTIRTFSDASNAGSGVMNIDVAAFIAADTRIRLVGNGALLGGTVTFDNVQIEFVRSFSGGTTAFSSATASSSITVTAVNDAPVGTSATLTATEDTPLTLNAAAFGFTDPVDAPANNFAGVTIASLPTAGALTLGGGAVTVGQPISLADINAGNLVYAPGLNGSGAGYASFTFRVQDDGGTAGGGAALDATARTLTFDVTAVNDAPVLPAANNVGAINEDAAGNPGTLVSALIAGHATDPDNAALSGIAVIGVDNTNGVCQYSTNAGASWLSFGDPRPGTARLLAADASTFVRFVPDANWNGTVANGLTFRAWDQTSGTNGGTAPTIPNPVLRDEFNVVSYASNDGTATWSTGWVDSDANVSGGQIHVKDGALEIRTNAGNDSVYRQADLTGGTSATLSFSYNNPMLPGDGGLVILQASNDGGASYVTLASFSDAINTGTDVFSADVSAFISAATRIRFEIVTPSSPSRIVAIDNVQIAYTTAGNGGGTAFSTASASSAITVVAVNDAPAGASNTVVAIEDSAFVFSAAAFGFTDPIDAPANALAAVRITTLPTAGTLTLGGAAMTAGQLVSVAELNAGDLAYTAAPNASGAGYASFTFQVQDDGGTANGGVNLDAVADTMTIDVTPVSDAPVGTSTTVTMLEDTTLVLNAAAFGFTDPFDVAANNLAAVRIASLPTAGTLTLSGAAVSGGQLISVGNINAGNLRFTPAANGAGAAYASFTFQVQDDGGAANGGTDLDSTARTLTIDVTAVNDRPAGADTTVTAIEDTPFVFTTAVFGFTDPDDTPANDLAAVHVATLPAAGSLTFAGAAVTAGQVISAADIAAGKVVFTAAANASGAGYASLTFKVQDSGGLANGGADLDAVARTITIDVAAANDAPAGASRTIVTLEDTAFVLDAAHFGFTDANDTPANNLLGVRITSLPTAGTLQLNGTAVSAGQIVSVVDINGGRLVYNPAADANGAGQASFTFQVQDDGGTANGGANLDPVARAMTIDVTPVNDAPTGADRTVSTPVNAAYTFDTAAFGFSDALDAPANGFLAVQITSLPGAGSLTLGNVEVAAGQIISTTDLAAGKLRFLPARDAVGAGHASFTFKVQDDGGGADLALAARRITIDVTPLPVAVPVQVIENALAPPAAETTRESTTVTSAAPAQGAAQTPAQATAAVPQAAAEAEPPPAVGATVDTAPVTTVAGGAAVQRLDVQQPNRESRNTVVAAHVIEPQVIELAAGERAAETGSFVMTSQARTSTVFFGPAAENREMMTQMDQMRDELREEGKVEAGTIAATAATSLSLSVGYVIWLLRGGVLLSTLVSSVPAWRFVDPLPVLGRMDDENDMDDEADDSLESLVARGDHAPATPDERETPRTEPATT